MTLPSDRNRSTRSAAPGPRGAKPRPAVSETIDPVMEVFGLSALWRLRAGSDAHPDASANMNVNAEAEVALPADALPLSRDASFDQAFETTPDVAAIVGRRASGEHAVPNVPSSRQRSDDDAVPERRQADAATDVIQARASRSPAIDLSTLDFETLRQRAQGCEACGLCETRKNVVFGVGDPRADWLFVGEGPGANEDEQGEPFVGQAGKLLDNMLRALGLRREENVFIANVVKCRPPGNRDPLPDEIAACEGYLQRQIALIQPKIIVALGRFAAQALLRSDATIGALRRINAGGGVRQAEGAAITPVHHYEGVPVVVTYHPAYLLRTPSDKAKVWEDLCRARDVFAR